MRAASHFEHPFHRVSPPRSSPYTSHLTRNPMAALRSHFGGLFRRFAVTLPMGNRTHSCTSAIVAHEPAEWPGSLTSNSPSSDMIGICRVHLVCIKRRKPHPQEAAQCLCCLPTPDPVHHPNGQPRTSAFCQALVLHQPAGVPRGSYLSPGDPGLYTQYL